MTGRLGEPTSPTAVAAQAVAVSALFASQVAKAESELHY
jgi:hypothetical protein